MSEWRAEVRRRIAAAKLEPMRENEIVDEIVLHLEDRHAELVARGATPAEAEASVLAELDGNEVLARRLRGIERPAPRDPIVPGEASHGVLSDLGHDVRYAVRALRKSPGFTAVTLLSLALGVGANTAIFQLLDSLHLRTLPVERAGELVRVQIRDRHWGSGHFTGAHPDLTFQLWEHLRKEQQAFSGMLAFQDRTVNLSPQGEARWARALLVSGDYFRVLGVRPTLGRTFGADDDRRGCTEPGAVISDGFWRREYGADPSAVGKNLTLDGHSVGIIGVAPPGFFGLEVGRSFDVAVPICMEGTLSGERSMLDVPHAWWLAAVGRLKPGWTLERANAHIELLGKTLLDETVPAGYSADNIVKYKEYQLGAFPGANGVSNLREDYSEPLYFLLAIAALVLLIACANLANLLLARASAREREISIRLALGASRGRLVRQLMAESLLIALLGAALGLLMASLLSDLLVAFLSTRNDQLFVTLTIDWRVLGFTAGLAGLTCVLFGLTPALRATRADVGAVLKSAAGRSATAGRERFGLRRVLVAVQVALSFVLLFGALLFVRSLRNLVTVDPGFRDSGAILLSVDARPLKLPKERRLPFVADLLARLRATPGVDAAAAIAIVPISGSGWNDGVWPDGGDKAKSVNVTFNRGSQGYFKAIGTAFVAGRDFTDADTLQSPMVGIVNEQLVKKVFDGKNPIGQKLRIEAGPGGEPEEVFEIVGVVRDAKYRTLREEFPATAFVAFAQDKDPQPYADIVIRTGLPTAGVVASVKQTVTDFEPNLIMDFDLLSRMVDESVIQERLMATLAGFFGLLAALLATIGLYGVVSYSVARRVHEIGIRMALGAKPGKVSEMIVKEAAELLLFGLAGGLGLALLGAYAARAMLYGLAPYDPVTVVMSMGLLAAVAITASVIPAWRAARVDPMTALREE
jgi:predicted permease